MIQNTLIMNRVIPTSNLNHIQLVAIVKRVQPIDIGSEVTLASQNVSSAIEGKQNNRNSDRNISVNPS